MNGDRPTRGRRWGKIAVGLGLLAAAASHAGEITVRSDRKVKVNLGGKRVLGTFEPEQGVVISGLRDGRHKIYVKDIATGEFDMVLVDIPQESGTERRVDFGAKTIQSTRPPPPRPAAPPRAAARAEAPPTVAEGPPAWQADMTKLFDLHEVSLDTLEAMQRQLDRMKQQVTDAESKAVAAARDAARSEPRARDTRAPAPSDVQVYAYLDSELSRVNSTADKGSFDINHATLGVTGPVWDNWTARLEYTLQHGFTDMGAAGTTGNAEMERGFLEYQGGHTHFRVGKFFNPFGFWSPNQYEIYNDTVQAPLQFDNLYSDTQTGLHWEWDRHGNQIGLGVFNGDGSNPDQTDDNDNKGFLLSWVRDDFMDGRVGIHYNNQRDGTQGNRREEKWIASVDQDWGKVKFLSEYFFEKSSRFGQITDNDAWYADLTMDIGEKWYSTLRMDWIRADPNAASDDHNRTLLNFGIKFSPLLRFKADFYHDRFASAAMRDQRGMDLQVAAAIGL